MSHSFQPKVSHQNELVERNLIIAVTSSHIVNYPFVCGSGSAFTRVFCVLLSEASAKSGKHLLKCNFNATIYCNENP